MNYEIFNTIRCSNSYMVRKMKLYVEFQNYITNSNGEQNLVTFECSAEITVAIDSDLDIDNLKLKIVDYENPIKLKNINEDEKETINQKASELLKGKFLNESIYAYDEDIYNDNLVSNVDEDYS